MNYNHLKYNFSEDRLHTISILIEGNYIKSKNNTYYATLLSNGKLTIFKGNNFNIKENIIWQSLNINDGETPYHLVMQDDGNSVIYDKNQKAIWSTSIWATQNGPWYLQITNEGNLIIFDRHRLSEKNFKEMQDIYAQYNPQGLQILAFPCNQFKGQEPNPDDKIIQGVINKFKVEVKYPYFQKSEVNGKNTNPVYQFLRMNSTLNKQKSNFIPWNFAKFLVNQQGQVVKYTEPTVSPKDLEKDIVELLNKQ